MARPSKAPERRKQIVWALYDCLSKNGHETVSIKSIAKAADLPPGVIHYYFDKKDDIVSGLAQAIVDKYSEHMEERLTSVKSGRERIEVLLDFVVEELIFNEPLNRAFYNLIQMAFERSDLRRVIKQMFQDYRGRLADVFAEAGAGDVSPTLGAALVAVAEGFALQWMVAPEVFKPVEVRRFVAQALADRLPAKLRPRL
jgi:AcrR family transcriptional regulator